MTSRIGPNDTSLLDNFRINRCGYGCENKPVVVLFAYEKYADFEAEWFLDSVACEEHLPIRIDYFESKPYVLRYAHRALI